MTNLLFHILNQRKETQVMLCQLCLNYSHMLFRHIQVCCSPFFNLDLRNQEKHVAFVNTSYTWSQILVKIVNTQCIKNLNDTFVTKSGVKVKKCHLVAEVKLKMSLFCIFNTFNFSFAIRWPCSTLTSLFPSMDIW